ncbi:MAG TPA: metal-dependent hydrolase [Bryobacteraceae bacterium]|jgi:inner membrane protein|nr:metal-dependent hydrolase [Bryobacteraceae bacterium]
MDNLTHTAVGLFLGRAGLNRWTPRATAILILAANAPDFDAVSGFWGPLTYLQYHRHLTHSFIAMPVVAILCVLAVRAFSRKPVAWAGAFFAALIGVFSHLLLDYTNGYGIRLLLPFSTRFYRLEWTAVIDVWIWAALFVGLAAPFLSRLVSSEITSSAARSRYPGRGWPIFALLFVLLYNCARGAIHARAVDELQSRIYNDAEPLRAAAVPNAYNPLKWRGVVDTKGFFAVTDIDLARQFNPERAQLLYKSDYAPAMDAAKRTETFQVFLNFAEFPAWSVAPDPKLEGGKVVTATEVRYEGWSAKALEDAQNHVLRSWFQFGVLVEPR